MIIIKPDLSIAQKDTSFNNGYYITYPDKLMRHLLSLLPLESLITRQIQN